MGTTAPVRTSKAAIAAAAFLTARVNKERKKLKKEKLSQSQVIALAIENLTVQQGIDA